MKKAKLTERFGAKLLAWFLLAFSVLGMLASAAAIVAEWELDVYSAADAEALKQAQFNDLCISLGNDVARCVISYDDPDWAQSLLSKKNAAFRVLDPAGAEMWKSDGFDALADSPYRFSHLFRRVTEEDGAVEYYYIGGTVRKSRVDLAMPEPTVTPAPEPTLTPAPVMPTGVPALPVGKEASEAPSAAQTQAETEEYLLEAAVDPALPQRDAFYWMGLGMELLWSLRYAVYALAGASLLLTAVCFIFLLCAAGHRAGAEGLTPGYLTRVPFDLLTAAAALACAGVIGLTSEAGSASALMIVCTAAAVLILALLFTGWCTSLALRIKLGRWWENTVLFRLLRLLWRGASAVGRGLAALARALPLLWKTVLLLLAVSFLELFAYFGLELRYNTEWLLTLWFLEKLVLGGAVLWFVLMLRRLQRGGAALAAGDLRYHTDTRAMPGDLRRHGENLNSIAAGMEAAVARQMRSERMKTELITNVSHDIKTPLTSIINYVDLLKDAETPEQRAECLDVLDRQSRRLKKLTEDLIEVSKASTGNVEVRLARHSVCELLRQVSGEYSERFAAAGLEPVLTLPEGELFAALDGRLMWRVLDNLLSNVCKYAQSGTRVYLDAFAYGGSAVIRLRNVSREKLNLSAEELMERFVRGDRARGGEGSGLGLSIARSLTELQRGAFRLTVDGDLFKVELVFPLDEA